MKGTFQAALAAAPLDLAEAWAAAVRFAVNALAYSNPAGMDDVLQVIIQQPPQGKCLSALNHKHSKATFIPGVLIVPCMYNPQMKHNPGSSNSPENNSKSWTQKVFMSVWVSGLLLKSVSHLCVRLHVPFDQ